MLDSPIVAQMLWPVLVLEAVLAIILIGKTHICYFVGVTILSCWLYPVPFGNAFKLKLIIMLSKIESSNARYVANVAASMLVLIFLGEFINVPGRLFLSMLALYVQ